MIKITFRIRISLVSTKLCKFKVSSERKQTKSFIGILCIFSGCMD